MMRAWRGLAAVGLWLVLAAPGLAQGIEPSDDVPTVDLAPLLDTLPPDAGEPAVSADQPLTIMEYARRPGETTGAPTGAGTILLPFYGKAAEPDRILRLAGERQSTKLFVRVPDPAAVLDFVLSYRVSINVLPSRSLLLIRVNGTDLPPVVPGAFEEFEAIELPRDLLVEGVNEIEVSARQAHRIFCGPDATFQIWTELDLSRSGVRVPLSTLDLNAEGFRAALDAQIALQGVIPARLEPGVDEKVLPHIARGLSGLAVGNVGGPRAETPYGVGSDIAPLARITVLADAPERIQVRRGAGGTMVLLLDGSDADGLPDFSEILPTMQSVDDVVTLAPAVETPLQALGFTDTTTFNRYSEKRLVFRLPEDWLVLSNAKAVLRLLYGFAEGLPRGAMMLVKVNGTTVRLLPLDVGNGQAQDPLDIGFSANLLNPGPNEVMFVAIIPGDPPDLPCPDSSQPLMTLLDGSTLLVPPSPQMAFAGLRGALAAPRPVQVEVQGGQADNEHVDDLVLALEANLRPIEGRETDTQVKLTVVVASDLGEMPFQAFGLGAHDLKGIFVDRPPEELEAPIMDPSAGPRYVRAALRPVREIADRVKHLAKPGDVRLSEWVQGRRADAALIMPDPDAPEALWLVAAPDVDPTRLATTLAGARMAPGGPDGHVSILTPEGDWQSWRDASVPPRLKEPLTIGNFRLIAGNYASWAPVYFAATLFGLTVCSVVLALIFVTSTRGRRKR